MEVLIIIILVAGFFITNIIYLRKNENQVDDNEINELRKDSLLKEEKLKTLESKNEILAAKMSTFEEIKIENAGIKEKLSNIEKERNQLQNENISLKKEEEARNETLRKSIESTNTLQTSLEKEKERINDERVSEAEEKMRKMQQTWVEHEKDINMHIQMICKNHLIKYIAPEDFPHKGKKPDNTIEILNQYIIFDAKSPANKDLGNFPKYIKDQTENLKKYAKHNDVKNDLFLVIPSNVVHVIQQFTYNIGDYNVYIITKDALEPIICSLKKVEEYEFADKLSPEERDDICRIIGKFAHTTKRRIQIDQFFAEEFLDALKKAGSQLPKDMLKTVIEFENAEKLNPPIEKRNKRIITNDLIEKSKQINKEIEIREIPDIDAQISFIEHDEKQNKEE